MPDLTGKVALVTGASRGIGKGIALGLGEAGATVYVTGRTVEGQVGVENLPGTIHQTAAEVTELGGQGIPIQCDHTRDEDVQALFQRISEEQAGLDILINNVWGGYEFMVENDDYTWERPFWEQPHWRWDTIFQTGVRAHYIASQFAAQMMVPQQSGLIVNISFWAGQKYIGNTAYGVAKAATDRLALDMAHELRPFNVAALSLYPGLVRTERIMRVADLLDLSNSESPQFLGRVVAALAADPNLGQKSGQILVAATLAQEYELTDIDGTRPKPLTLETA